MTDVPPVPPSCPWYKRAGTAAWGVYRGWPWWGQLIGALFLVSAVAAPFSGDDGGGAAPVAVAATAAADSPDPGSETEPEPEHEATTTTEAPEPQPAPTTTTEPPPAPAPPPPPEPSREEEIGDWYLTEGLPVMLRITSALDDAGTAATNMDLPGLRMACWELTQAAEEASGLTAVPDPLVEEEWRTAVTLFEEAGDECIAGVDDFDLARLEHSAELMTEGGAALDRAGSALLG